VKPDERSFRIALVADRYVNPPPGGLDGLEVLAAAGWGVMQLPADDYPADVTARILAEVAEQAEEFSRHGYDLVIVGECAGLPQALAAAGLTAPRQIVPSAAAELLAFLKARPAPPASDWSWLAPGDADPQELV
jgi:hypothetical protein